MTGLQVDARLVPHPSWCDAAECRVYDDRDGTLTAFHERRLLDEVYPVNDGGAEHDITVMVMQAIGTTVTGDVVDVSGQVFIEGSEFGGGGVRLPAELLPQVIAALTRGTTLLALAEAELPVGRRSAVERSAV